MGGQDLSLRCSSSIGGRSMKGGRGEGKAAIDSRRANILGDDVADSNFVWWEGGSCFSYVDFVILCVVFVFIVVVCVTR